MARFYADEQYPYPVVEWLRTLGHDVLTVQEAGNANQRIPDPDVLAFATQEGRAVLTQNRKDFIRLHQQQIEHVGIIACTSDRDWQALATRIDERVGKESTLWGMVIWIVRPSQ
jgi:predicted nuclease of predicted toxin-antitoxin system